VKNTGKGRRELKMQKFIRLLPAVCLAGWRIKKSFGGEKKYGALYLG
jgi:hypothetical protein